MIGDRPVGQSDNVSLETGAVVVAYLEIIGKNVPIRGDNPGRDIVDKH